MSALRVQRFASLETAWAEPGASERLRRLRRAGHEVREQLLGSGPVDAVASCPLVTFPYPTLFAFSGGARSPAPYVMMTNRLHVVQFRDWDGVRRTLLFNPSDYARGLLAPFYANLTERFGGFVSGQLMRLGRHGTVEGHLERLGLSPGDVDYLAYDHLHIQDVRRWLGGDGDPQAYFPRARLLVMRPEWRTVQDPHPMQQVWYVPDGGKGVGAERVELLDGDAWLGPGVALLRTPGHTEGNMSLVFVTPDGPWVVSENGVATESYTPLQSAVPGVRAYAEQYGIEVVLNGNTREGSLDQYSSMVLEKTVAGPSKVDPAFVNFLPSSELTSSLLAPLLAPGFSHGDVSHGELHPTGSARERRAS